MEVTYKKLLITNKRKVRMTSSPYGLYDLGYTRATLEVTKSNAIAKGWSKSIKAFLFGL